MRLSFFLIEVGVTNAHAIFLSFEVDVNNEISYNVRTLSYDGPLTDVDSDSLACDGDPNLTTPEDVMDASHFGPAMAYLKKVDAAVTTVGAGVSGSRSGKWLQ
ncbi:hypothetical protein EDB80DRAFT_879437 [Ilyonectria destructans]|nr:hypothetical protein EDB80DRAFT_879437 [Ilyonectria destructans]